MPEIDFREICLKFLPSLNTAFLERIERRLGTDIQDALSKNPEELLINILQDIQLYYIIPFESALESTKYLREKYGIDKSFLCFSKYYDYPISEKTEDIQIVGLFYDMISALGFEQILANKSGKKWWQNEF